MFSHDEAEYKHMYILTYVCMYNTIILHTAQLTLDSTKYLINSFSFSSFSVGLVFP